MSINELIKNKLSTKNLKLPKLLTKVTHCQNQHYDYCLECRHHTNKKCNGKLFYRNFVRINDSKWHFYFICSQKHLVIRWVVNNSDKLLVGNLKN